jgi:hypothetical protein
LGSFPLDRNGLFGFLEPLDVTLDGVFGHGPRMIQVFAFGDKAGQGGNRNGVPPVLVGLEKGSVFVDAMFAVLPILILSPK